MGCGRCFDELRNDPQVYKTLKNIQFVNFWSIFKVWFPNHWCVAGTGYKQPIRFTKYFKIILKSLLLLLLLLLLTNLLHGLWNQEVQCRINKGSPIIPILSRNNPIPSIDSLPISSKTILRVILSLHLRLSLPKGLYPVGLPVKILKELLPSSILAKCPSHLNLLDLITLSMLGNGTIYEIPHCEPSPLPILIPLGLKYSPQDPVFKYP